MKKPFAVLAGKLAILLCGATAFCGLVQAQPGWEVSGAVTGDTGPVKGVLITLAGPESTLTRTDGQGRYSLKGAAEGRYLLRAEKEEMSAPPPRALSLGKGVRLRVDIRIPKGAVVTGRVVDENKQPVAGLTVSARSKSIRDGQVRLRPIDEDLTNDLGEYRIPHLSDGNYVIVVTPMPLKIRRRSAEAFPPPGRGYPPLTFPPGTRELAASTTVRLRSGEERAALDVEMRKEVTYCISFQIDSSFVGTDFRLEERISPLGPQLAEAKLQSAGTYEVCGVASGEYRLHFYTFSSAPVRLIGAFTVAATVDKRNVDLGPVQMVTPTEVRGSVAVKDAKDGDPVPANLRVRLLPHEEDTPLHRYALHCNVETSGAFVLPRVFMDSYGVRVEGLPAGYYLIGASQQGRDVLDDGLSPVGGAVRITLASDGATVSGRVMAADDAVIPDALLFLVPKEHGPPLMVHSDQDGTYLFKSGVQPGEYRLVAAQDLSEWEQGDPETIARLAANGMELKLAPRETRTIDLRIPASR